MFSRGGLLAGSTVGLWLSSIMMAATPSAIFVVQAMPNPFASMVQLPLHHHRHRSHKSRELLDQTPLFETASAHDVDLWCGTPTPQKRRVNVDTGSVKIAFPCAGCTNCEAVPDPYFQPSQSATFQKINCNTQNISYCDVCTASGECDVLSYAYGDGSSWSAYYASDECFLDGRYPNSTTSSPFAFDLIFGCQTNVSGSFVNGHEDGIMGMGYSSEAFWSQMYQAGKIPSEMFSVCYAFSNTIVDTVGVDLERGILTLGGSDTSLHTTATVFSGNASQDDGFYHVTIRKLYLQGGSNDTSTSIHPIAVDASTLLNNSDCIVDSGNPIASFSAGLADDFAKAWLSVVGTPFNNTQEFATYNLNDFPTVYVQLVGDPANALLAPNPFLAGSLDPQNPFDVLLAIPPSHYIQAYSTFLDGSIATYATQITFSGSRGNLGANFIMEKDVLFDVTNGRLGWAASSCNYTQAALAPTTSPVAPTTAPITPTAAPVVPTTAPVAPTTAPVVPTIAPVAPTTAPVAPTTAPITPTAAPIAPTTAPITPTAAPVAPSKAPITPTKATIAPTTAITPTVPSVAPTTAPINPTVAPVAPTAAPVAPTVAPVAPTAAPAAPTVAPVAPTVFPIAPTKAPVVPTSVPVEPTKTPIEPTKTPVAPTKAPFAPTKAPAKPTSTPVKPSAAPFKPIPRPSNPPVTGPAPVPVAIPISFPPKKQTKMTMKNKYKYVKGQFGGAGGR